MAKDDEQLYLFIDKTGRCFKKFQRMGDSEAAKNYNDVIGAWLRGGKVFGVGDMLALRDDLLNAGFKWGKDFFVTKV